MSSTSVKRIFGTIHILINGGLAAARQASGGDRTIGTIPVWQEPTGGYESGLPNERVSDLGRSAASGEQPTPLPHNPPRQRLERGRQRPDGFLAVVLNNSPLLTAQTGSLSVNSLWMEPAGTNGRMLARTWAPQPPLRGPGHACPCPPLLLALSSCRIDVEVSPDRNAARLFAPQSLDRVKAGSAAGREIAETDANQTRKCEG
jgi:hypothetical protein